MGGLALAPALSASGAQALASALPVTRARALAPAWSASGASGTASGRGTIGGPQLAGHGVIVNYPATHATWLPNL